MQGHARQVLAEASLLVEVKAQVVVVLLVADASGVHDLEGGLGEESQALRHRLRVKHFRKVEPEVVDEFFECIRKIGYELLIQELNVQEQVVAD